MSLWRYAQSQIKLRNYDNAIVALRELTTQRGVSDALRVAADRTLVSLAKYDRQDASSQPVASSTDSNAQDPITSIPATEATGQDPASSTSATDAAEQDLATSLSPTDAIGQDLATSQSAIDATGQDLATSIPAPDATGQDSTTISSLGSESSAVGAIAPPVEKKSDDVDENVYPESKFSVGVEYAHTSNDDKEFEGTGKEHELENKTELTIDHEYEFNRRFSSVVELEFSVERNNDYKKTIDDDGNVVQGESSYFKAGEFSRGDTYVSYDFSKGKLDRKFSIGTQTISSDRSWFWDDDLDLVTLSMDKDDWELNTGVGTRFVDPMFGKGIDFEDRDIWHLFGEFQWEYRKDHSASLLLLSEYDASDRQSIGDLVSASQAEDDKDNRIYWLGMSYSGEFFKKGRQPVEYWFDIATVYGEEVDYDFDKVSDSTSEITEKVETVDLRGWGLDLGVLLPTRLPGEPEFKIGFATTSSDNNLEDGTDKTFTQTGLQDNNYGLVLEPDDLSNMTIMTLGVEFEPVSDVKIEIAYYDFRHVVVTDKFRNVDVDADMDGIGKKIGTELGIEVEISIWDPFEFGFSFGVFKAGDSVDLEDHDDTVEQGTFEIKYEF